jgi:tight adherence protein B
MRMQGFLILLGAASIFLLSYQLLKVLSRNGDYISRLNRYTNVEEAREERKKEAKKTEGMVGKALSESIGKVKLLEGYKKKLQVDLNRAHLLLKAEEFMALGLILFCLFAVAIIMIKGIGMWPLALIFGIGGWFLPVMAIKAKIKKRIKILNEQLGDAVSMMSNSLKAGYSFFQAIDMLANEMTGPISEEFSTLMKEINLGLTTEKAMENMASRVKSDDLDLVITAVLIQRTIGGNLAEVLDNITTTIRDRVKILGEIKTVTAQGRMSGLVISLLPVIMYVILYMMSPEKMSLLFSRPLGQLMLVAGIVLELIGIMLIKKIVKIEI